MGKRIGVRWAALTLVQRKTQSTDTFSRTLETPRVCRRAFSFHSLQQNGNLEDELLKKKGDLFPFEKRDYIEK